MTQSGTSLRNHSSDIRRIALLIAACFGLLWPAASYAQYFETGQDPFSMRWEKLETANFRVLYDEGFRAEAVRLARLMESYRIPASQSLGADPEPITVIVHSRSVISNAMVPIAPRRLEFYSLPPQDGLSQEWFRHLSIHEYRHVAQMDVLHRSFTKGLSVIFGEQALAAVFGVMVPFWFIEGDATVMETALGESGRGRDPDFIRPLRTQLLEIGSYSYNKAVFRSYKDYVPDRYILGYHLVALGREYYGAQIWQNALENTARRPWAVRPFSQSLRKQTGTGTVRFYKAMTDSLTAAWESVEGPYDEFKGYPVRESKVYTDYRHPYPYEDGSVVCLKKRMDDIPRFVLIDSTGREEVLFTPGYIMDESIGYGDGVIAWTEFQSDRRWENQSFSDLWVYDVRQRKATRLTQKSRYFSPSVSMFGRRIAVSYTDENNNHEMHILDGRTGRVITRFRHPSNSQIVNPRWAYNDSLILFISAGSKGRGIQSVDPSMGLFRIVMPDTYTELSHVSGADGGVFFTAGMGGARNVYVMDLVWNYIWQLTHSKYGVRDPYFDPSTKLLWYSEYGSAGYRPKAVDISLLSQLQVTDANRFSLDLADKLSIQENYDSSIEQDSFRYEISRYNRWLHMVRPHSWAPLSISASSQSVTPGFSVLSQDLLGTVFMEAGYSADINERTGQWYLDGKIKCFYPVIDFRYSWGIRNSVYKDNQSKLKPFSWVESTLRGGISLPLNFHRGQWLSRAEPSVRYSRINLGDYDADDNSGLDGWGSLFLFGRSPYTSTPSFINTGLVNSFDYGLYLANQRRSSVRDFRPVWAQMINLRYRHSPWGERTLGRVYGVNSAFYFPGFIKQHSIRLGLGAQVREDGNSLYSYSYVIPTPRGISGITDDTLSFASLSYAFPILYPDLNLGPLAYIKRIKADLFTDMAAGSGTSILNGYRSFGADLTFEGHFLRFVSPAVIGLRTVYAGGLEPWSFSLIFQVNFEDI